MKDKTIIPNPGFKEIEVQPMHGTNNIILRADIKIGDDWHTNRIILSPEAQKDLFFVLFRNIP